MEEWRGLKGREGQPLHGGNLSTRSLHIQPSQSPSFITMKGFRFELNKIHIFSFSLAHTTHHSRDRWWSYTPSGGQSGGRRSTRRRQGWVSICRRTAAWYRSIGCMPSAWWSLSAENRGGRLGTGQCSALPGRLIITALDTVVD